MASNVCRSALVAFASVKLNRIATWAGDTINEPPTLARSARNYPHPQFHKTPIKGPRALVNTDYPI